MGKQDQMGIQDSLGKLEIKIFKSQKLFEGVENFASFVMGETHINIATTKLAGGNSLSGKKI